MNKNAIHISFCSDTKDIYTQTCIALRLLEIKYQGALKPVVNPTKRPHFLTIKWTIIVHKDDENTVVGLLKLTSPILKYAIKNGYFVERLQRKDSAKLLTT